MTPKDPIAIAKLGLAASIAWRFFALASLVTSWAVMILVAVGLHDKWISIAAAVAMILTLAATQFRRWSNHLRAALAESDPTFTQMMEEVMEQFMKEKRDD